MIMRAARGATFLLDDNGVMVGYLDGRSQERDMAGNPIPSGATPTPGAFIVSDAILLAWASVQAWIAVTATRGANEAIVTATITWPDGASGVFTTDTASTAFPGAIDAWHATYVGARTRTLTQTLVTRDAAGAVTVQPTITIS